VAAISPWAASAELASPDGRTVARVADASEIAMGAPTSGTLQLSNGMSRESCNPSMVWSDDSAYLAVPQWTRERRQRLLIVSVARQTSRYAPGEYRVLELHAFRDGVVSGVDSPVYQSRPVAVDVRQLAWD
jgi:hypothetical protein